MENTDIIIDKTVNEHRKRLRVILIIYFFSEPYSNSDYPDRIRLLKDEQKIQKLDFLIRYPDYLCYELLSIIDNNIKEKEKIKNIVKNIFDTNEPTIRKDEMERFFYGAWERIDDAILFLHAHQLIFFESRRRTDGKTHNKHYYLLRKANDRIEKAIKEFSGFHWYAERCELIKDFFGDMTGKQLRLQQYQHEEYSQTPFREYIKSIEGKVKSKYKTLFNEEL